MAYILRENFYPDPWSDPNQKLFTRIRGTGNYTWETGTTTPPDSGITIGRLLYSTPGSDSVWRVNGPRIADGGVATVMARNGSAGNTHNFGAIMKMIDNNNFLMCQFTVAVGGGSGNLQLWKYDNNAFVQLGSNSVATPSYLNSTYWINFLITGNVLSAGVGAVSLSGSGSDATFFAALGGNTVTYTLAGADATKFGAGVKGSVGWRHEAGVANTDRFDSIAVRGSGGASDNHTRWHYFTGAGADNGATGKAVVDQMVDNGGHIYLGDVSPANSSAGFTTGFEGTYARIKGYTYPIPGEQDWAASDPTRHEQMGMYDEYWARRAKPDGNHHHYAYSPEAGISTSNPWRIIVLNTEELGGAGNGLSDSQLGFLDYELGKDKGNMKVVVGHRPRWSSSSVAGKGDQADLDPVWNLMKGRACLYVAGHSRNYQRHLVRDGIIQVVAGAGGMGLDAINGSYPNIAYHNDASNAHGTLRLRFRDASTFALTGEYVNYQGTVLDTFTISDAIHPTANLVQKTALDNPWKFVLTSADGATIYGELTNASERSVADPHMGTPSLGCSIRIDHPLALTVLNEECLIKAYRGSKMIFHGPVVSVEEAGGADARSLRITAAGVHWRATKRIIRQSTEENGFSLAPTSIESGYETILGAGNGIYNGSYYSEFFTGIADN